MDWFKSWEILELKMLLRAKMLCRGEALAHKPQSQGLIPSNTHSYTYACTCTHTHTHTHDLGLIILGIQSQDQACNGAEENSGFRARGDSSLMNT